jgi:hypothetical protein
MEQLFFQYLSSLVPQQPPVHSTDDLASLSTKQLLELANQVQEGALGFFVQVLKSSQSGIQVFDKLMGEHNEENSALVDGFFKRYMNEVMRDEEEMKEVNPLVYYMPQEYLDDLAFLTSRESFFKSQTQQSINEYLWIITGKEYNFQADQQNDAWQTLWSWVLQSNTHPA